MFTFCFGCIKHKNHVHIKILVIIEQIKRHDLWAYICVMLQTTIYIHVPAAEVTSFNFMFTCLISMCPA